MVFILLLASIAGLLFVSRNNSPDSIAGEVILTSDVNTPSYGNDLIMNNLLKEYSAISILHLRGIYDGRDTTATEILLSGNKNNFVDLIGDLYGRESQNRINIKWQEYIDLYEDYTLAKKNNDWKMQNDVRSRLVTMSDEMGESFSEIEPHLNRQRVTELMRERIELTLGIVDVYAANNFSELARLTKELSDQDTIFSYYLSQNMKSDIDE